MPEAIYLDLIGTGIAVVIVAVVTVVAMTRWDPMMRTPPIGGKDNEKEENGSVNAGQNKLYRARDLEELGMHYQDHLRAIDNEHLHDISAIAAELAVRDMWIAILQSRAAQDSRLLMDAVILVETAQKEVAERNQEIDILNSALAIHQQE